MAADRYGDICARVREHCRQQGWYGPDADKPRTRFQPIYGWGPPEDDILPYAHTRGCAYTHSYAADKSLHTFIVDNATDPRYHDFECLPATGDQLAATERALGFPLPPLLRALFLGVANGGFGPSYGITGAASGWSMDDDQHYDTLDCIDLVPYKVPETRLVELSEYDKSEEGTSFEFVFPYDEYPAHFLPFCYSGCGIDHCVDLRTGRIYANLGGVQEHMGRWSLGVVREALSLDDWIEAWLRDNSQSEALLRSGGNNTDGDVPL